MTFVLDPISQAAYDAMRNTQDNILLLGKAGTGKSTLISNYIAAAQKSKGKNIAVVAPTGVAAMNIGGQTIHSFFKFSANVTIDDARQRALRHKKQKIYLALDTLIIDEISMVRADLLDCIDVFLRTARKNYAPFGGVQVIMVWDLLQLPPIVSAVESVVFADTYSSAYFFDAMVMKNPACRMHPYQLEKVYRQEEISFVDLLHRIRNNTVSPTDLDIINSRVQRVTTINPWEIYISTTNSRANDVNNTMLSRLTTDEYRSFATSKGKISASSYPTDDELVLKIWAQVMFVVNNVEKWFMNGTLGVITDITEYEYEDSAIWDELEVTIRIHNNNEEVIVTPHTREIRESKYDEKDKTIKTEVVWVFKQLPIRLARACTIHKAQGKTFDSMIIDSGNGMFAPWQAYVALSRCTSLQGIKLIKPMMLRDILIDNVVSNYLNNLATVLEHPVPEQPAWSIHSIVTPAIRKAVKDKIKKISKATPPTRVLVFDTETTGVDASARIVQLACALYEKGENNEWVCTSLYNHLINPWCPIPAETTAVHGIDDAMVKDAPTLDTVWENIFTVFNTAEIHVAHNHAFDDRIMTQEIRRLKLEKLSKRPVYCTMREWVDIARISNSRGWYKWPKLAELYTHLWGKEIDGYHDALVDVKAAAACYFKLKWEEFNPFE